MLYQTESSHQNAHTLFKIESFPALRELFDQVFEVSSEIVLPHPPRYLLLFLYAYTNYYWHT